MRFQEILPARLPACVGNAGRFALEFGHLGRILAGSPGFFETSSQSIRAYLTWLAAFFCAEGVRPEGPRAQAKAHARQLKRLNGSLKRRRRVGA